MFEIFKILFIGSQDAGQVKAWDWSGEDGSSLIMVQDEETNVAVKRHKREFAGAVVVNDNGGFVGKSSDIGDVGNQQVVVNIVNDVKAGFGVGDVVKVNRREEAGYNGVLDLARDVNAWSFWSDAVGAFLRPFHVSL